MHLRLDEHHKRLTVHGWCTVSRPGEQGHYTPADVGLREWTLEIGVSSAKTPEQIAKDIQRRLIPDVMKVVEAAKAAAIRDQKYIDDRNAMAATLAETLGGKLQESHLGRTEPWVDFRGGTFHVKNIYTDSATLEVCLTRPQWAKLAPAILEALKPAQPTS